MSAILVRSAGLGTASAEPTRRYLPSSMVGGAPMIVGMFARFNQWTEIDSEREGRFMEIIDEGSFSRTIQRDRARIRILFNHGSDPSVGSKPLAEPEILREEPGRGAVYAGTLFPVEYAQQLIPALRAGQLGSSFRFRVLRESWNAHPPRSDFNPEALPQRAIREVELYEVGPVTFPAYSGATAGVS
jgi:HK97 family phage prohead protease